MIPQPNTSTGFIRSDDGLFEAMISNMSHDDFLEYIDLCSKKFNVQFEKVDVSESYDYSDEEYQATVDELDGTLSIGYTGFSNVIIRCIWLEKQNKNRGVIWIRNKNQWNYWCLL